LTQAANFLLLRGLQDYSSVRPNMAEESRLDLQCVDHSVAASYLVW